MTQVAHPNPLADDLYEHGMPTALFEQLRRESPCLHVELEDPHLIDSAWVLTRYDDVVEVLRDEQRFTSTAGVTITNFSMTSARRGGRPSLLTMARDDHRRVRPALGNTFTPRAIRLFAETYRQMAADLVRAAVSRGSFELVADIASQLPMRAICELIGVPEEDRAEVRLWGDAIASPGEAPADLPPPEAGRLLWEYTRALAEKRMTEPAEDIISRMVPLIAEGTLSMDELQGVIGLIAVAGNETTRNTISHSVVALIDNPDSWEFLRTADEAAWGCAVDEMLRWASPAVHLRRTAVVDVQLHDQTVKAGDAVVFMLSAANFDPRKFDRPEEFDIRRTPNPHVTFGVGGHFCLGAHLAKIETMVVLQELRRQTVDLRLGGAVSYGKVTHVRGVKQLPLTVIPA